MAGRRPGPPPGSHVGPHLLQGFERPDGRLASRSGGVGANAAQPGTGPDTRAQPPGRATVITDLALASFRRLSGTTWRTRLTAHHPAAPRPLAVRRSLPFGERYRGDRRHAPRAFCAAGFQGPWAAKLQGRPPRAAVHAGETRSRGPVTSRSSTERSGGREWSSSCPAGSYRWSEGPQGKRREIPYRTGSGMFDPG